MNKERLLKKLTLITFILEFILILVLLTCILYGYHQILGDGALNSLLRIYSPDDGIAGWFVLPAFIVDLFGLFGYVYIVFAAAIYLTVIMLAMGWNMWMAKQNKNNKLWMKIVGILPAVFLLIEVAKYVIPSEMTNGSILAMSYMLPAIISLIESIAYTHIKTKTIDN